MVWIVLGGLAVTGREARANRALLPGRACVAVATFFWPHLRERAANGWVRLVSDVTSTDNLVYRLCVLGISLWSLSTWTWDFVPGCKMVLLMPSVKDAVDFCFRAKMRRQNLDSTIREWVLRRGLHPSRQHATCGYVRREAWDLGHGSVMRLGVFKGEQCKQIVFRLI